MSDTDDTNPTPPAPEEVPAEQAKMEVFIREEILTIKRDTRQTYWVGLIFAVALAVYMGVILKMVREFTDPTLIAQNLSFHIERYVPELLKEAETQLIAQAPVMADNVSNTFIETVPKLRVFAEEQIKTVQADFIPYLSSEFQDIIRSYFVDNGAELEAFAVEHKDNPEAAANMFVAAMLDELAVELGNRLEIEADGRDANYFKHNLLYSLESIDAHLEQLTGDSAVMDHRHQLQRKIIAALVQRLTDHKLFEALPEPALPQMAFPEFELTE